MTDVGLAVGRRRAVEERKDLVALPLVDGLFENVVFVPEPDDFLFSGEEIQIRGDLFKHPDTSNASSVVIKKTALIPWDEDFRGTTQFDAQTRIRFSDAPIMRPSR